jgi:hypothetical protein
MWKLRADLMESQRREQTNHRFRDSSGDQREAVVLGDRSVWQPVSASCHAFEGACADEAAQRVGMKTRVGDFPPRDRAPPAGKAKQAVG